MDVANGFLNIFGNSEAKNDVNSKIDSYVQQFVSPAELRLQEDKMPKHIAIVMDGNGRWAKKRGLPRTLGHRQGVIAIENIVEACSELGVGYLTVFAFSTENWKRPQDEVSTLMKLLVEFAESKLARLCQNNVKIKVLGDMASLPLLPRQSLERLMAQTSDNTGLVFNMAINYGGRWEIMEAVKQLAAKAASGELDPNHITDEMISDGLTTQGQPDPDLLIRTSGEERLSNFLLWQMAYAELYFTDVLWPDFHEAELIRAIYHYQQRQRRFGGI